ncbi:MAG: isoprenylcysteine carboxylmethyltransferase family protein [Spirochaetales bacterium]|nr:isoprenylcysteine carboxylmethyltransferase family protein [Spirochaetales bacterium]
MKRARLIVTNILTIPFIIVFFGALLFFPAGNFYWINGWMFIVSLAIYLLLKSIYFIIKDPSTLEKRRKLSTEKGDNIIMVLIATLFLVLFLLPSFDYRFSWSQIPFFLSCIGFACLIISYLILFFVIRENSFASKGLRIHEDQKVITTGPYKLVRHPLYMGGIIMGIGIPLTLGSLIGLIPVIFLPFIYAVRIRKEEQMLLRDLKGYDEYRQKVKYRLIPEIW